MYVITVAYLFTLIQREFRFIRIIIHPYDLDMIFFKTSPLIYPLHNIICKTPLRPCL